MQFSIISIGDKMPAWVNDCCDDYYKRFPANIRLRQVELPMEKRSKNLSTAILKQRDTQRLLDAIPRDNFVVALDEKGRSFTTRKMAEKFQFWQDEAKDVSFLIGGPDGIDFDVLSAGKAGRTDLRWSLSELTFPHPLVRVILAEQLYRAWSVTAGHPYHRE